MESFPLRKISPSTIHGATDDGRLLPGNGIAPYIIDADDEIVLMPPVSSPEREQIVKPTLRVLNGEIILEAQHSPEEERQPSAKTVTLREPLEETKATNNSTAALRSQTRLVTPPAPHSPRDSRVHNSSLSNNRHLNLEEFPSNSSSSHKQSTFKPRSSLTEENVAYMRKLHRLAIGRSEPKERILGWLVEAGPPYELEPSVGVQSQTDSFSYQFSKSHQSMRLSWWRRFVDRLPCFGKSATRI